MKLLMTADAVGGVWQYATDLAAALAPLGVETVLAVVGPVPEGTALPEGAIATGLPLDWLAEDAEAVRAAGRRIAALASEVGADLVQLNSPALAAGGRFPCPVVAVAHGCVGTWWDAAEGTALPPDLAWRAELVREGLLAVDAVVAPSASYAAVVARRYALPVPPVVVHNGRAAVVAPVGNPADHALTVGRLWDRVKNTAFLDRVAARLPVPFLAAGTLTAPHGETVAPEHLTVLGSLSDADLAAELARRPVFVSAARFEPFGLAVLEAARAGCALVLADIPTFRELWDGAARFVAGEDEATWTATIERLLADPAERARLGEAARERSARYTPEKTAAAMRRLYDGLLAPARRAA